MRFIELKEIDCEYPVIINVEQILLIVPRKDKDNGLISIVELKSKPLYFGGPLKVAETVNEIMTKIADLQNKTLSIPEDSAPKIGEIEWLTLDETNNKIEFRRIK